MILVTGGAGYIGSHVVRQLSEAGRKVVVFDNLSTGSKSSLVHGEELLIGDLSDASAVSNAFARFSIRSVIHFAASTSVPESVTDPLKYYQNNLCTTINLLNACKEHAVEHFIFSSTAAVYGIPDSAFVSETSPTIPINPYGSSKLACEGVIKDTAAAHKVRYVILRYFNVAGADPLQRMGPRSREATHLIRICCHAALGKRDKVRIFGSDYPTPDGTGIRDYIHVEDIGSAHISALNYAERGGASVTLNVGYGKGSSVLEVIEKTKSITGKPIHTIREGRRQGDPPAVIANVELIRGTLDWMPRYHDLSQIISDSWKWEKKLNSAEEI